MLIPHKGHTDTIHVYSVTVMTHVKALQAGHSSQGTYEPITPALGCKHSLFDPSHCPKGCIPITRDANIRDVKRYIRVNVAFTIEAYYSL